MSHSTVQTPSLIVGRRMPGATAARRLQHQGIDVVVVDTGGAVGGRVVRVYRISVNE